MNKFFKLSDTSVLQDTYQEFKRDLADPPSIETKALDAAVADAAAKQPSLKGLPSRSSPTPRWSRGQVRCG